ncbi:hypothetical protein FOA52_004124 [Chlamydomonas sp. UWO 241]|nr:hypothetical protein FOA52_004124 [Chlamydomonas sp. UWO 241]
MRRIAYVSREMRNITGLLHRVSTMCAPNANSMQMQSSRASFGRSTSNIAPERGPSISTSITLLMWASSYGCGCFATWRSRSRRWGQEGVASGCLASSAL